MNIVAATNNPGKLRELREILEGQGHQVLSLADVGFTEEIEETGKTFAENAWIKAETVLKITGLPTVADDSGLEVDALGGAPGVYSARYAEPGARKAKLLEELREVPQAERGAQFVSAIAFALPDGRKIFTEGVCRGEIAFKCSGEGGFGYDPLFYVPEFGCTFAEMSPKLKNTISHRAKALAALEIKLKGI